MFDRKSQGYQQLINDIAEAVLNRVDGRIEAIEELMNRLEQQPAWAARTATFAVPRLPPGALRQLTPKERMVLEAIVAGGTNKEIGRLLGISPRTVELHRARVHQKLGVSGTAALVMAAIEAGVLPRAEQETKTPPAS